MLHRLHHVRIDARFTVRRNIPPYEVPLFISAWPQTPPSENYALPEVGQFDDDAKVELNRLIGVYGLEMTQSVYPSFPALDREMKHSAKETKAYLAEEESRMILDHRNQEMKRADDIKAAEDLADLEAKAKAKADRIATEARIKMEAEARIRAEAEAAARLKAEAEARVAAERQANADANEAAKVKAAEEAQANADANRGKGK